MKGKDLSENEKNIYDHFEELKRVDGFFTPLQKMGNFYYSHQYRKSISVTYVDPKDHKEGMEINGNKIYDGWSLYTKTNFSKSEFEINENIMNSDDFNTILKLVVDICYENVNFDEEIEGAKEEIELIEERIEKLEYVKNLQNTL
jgi:hypothetical protein